MDGEGPSPTSKDRDVRVLASLICVIIAPMLESGTTGLPAETGFPTYMAQWTLNEEARGSSTPSREPNPFLALDLTKAQHLKTLVSDVLLSVGVGTDVEVEGSAGALGSESDARFLWSPAGPSGVDSHLAGLLATRDVALFLGLSHPGR